MHHRMGRFCFFLFIKEFRHRLYELYTEASIPHMYTLVVCACQRFRL